MLKRNLELLIIIVVVVGGVVGVVVVNVVAGVVTMTQSLRALPPLLLLIRFDALRKLRLVRLEIEFSVHRRTLQRDLIVEQMRKRSLESRQFPSNSSCRHGKTNRVGSTIDGANVQRVRVDHRQNASKAFVVWRHCRNDRREHVEAVTRAIAAHRD